MKRIIDIVNLNADASCLSSERWLEMLEGGKGSELYSWFNNYVELNKKVVLGITGSTLSDIYTFNSECLDLLRSNPQIFEFIVRPYSHDIALLRSNEGFLFNLRTGIKLIETLNLPYINFYLAPEFMLTNTQVKLLEDSGIEGTFINYGRFKAELHDRIPRCSYRIKGIMTSSLKCIPFESSLTQAFLHGLHNFNADNWNKLLENNASNIVFSWRDGESAFFIPDGIVRESSWLNHESKNIQRMFLSDVLNELSFPEANSVLENAYQYYPTHSFMAWMRESKMFGFLNKIENLEVQLSNLTLRQQSLWLLVINSDILSSIEKNSPTIRLLDINTNREFPFTILRSNRGVEGEELLYFFEKNLNVSHAESPFYIKLEKRMQVLEKVISE